ncbi:hypothetical protein Hanom_Chr08g00754721 [Helianthus anomalus]
MHNVQDLKHKKTQTIYPLHESSSTVHFFHLFTRIMIWTADIQLTRINLSHSIPSHNSHISQNFINLLSRRLMNRFVPNFCSFLQPLECINFYKFLKKKKKPF